MCWKDHSVPVGLWSLGYYLLIFHYGQSMDTGFHFHGSRVQRFCLQEWAFIPAFPEISTVYSSLEPRLTLQPHRHIRNGVHPWSSIASHCVQRRVGSTSAVRQLPLYSSRVAITSTVTEGHALEKVDPVASLVYPIARVYTEKISYSSSPDRQSGAFDRFPLLVAGITTWFYATCG